MNLANLSHGLTSMREGRKLNLGTSQKGDEVGLGLGESLGVFLLLLT